MYEKAVKFLYLPFDFPWVISRALNICNPKKFVFVAYDLWPNFLWLAKYKSIHTSIFATRIKKDSNKFQPFVKNFNPLFESKDGQHPTLLKEYLGKRISLETMIVLDDLVEFSKRWDKELVWDDFIWPDVKKLMNNYKGFLTIKTDKYRMKLLKLIEESS